MNRQELNEQIDACRGPADLAMPELRPLADRMETDPATRRLLEKSFEIDDAIRAAVADVPIPQGLEDRLLNTVLSVDPVSSDVPSASGEQGTVNKIERPGDSARNVRRHGRSSWRTHWKWWTPVGVAAALLAVFLWPPAESDSTADIDVVKSVRNWMVQVASAEVWRTDGFPISQYPWPPSLRMQPRRWMKVSDSSGWRGVVCYDLATKGATPARLFVAQTPHHMTSLPTSPQPRPYARIENGKWAVGVWRVDYVVYVLAVEGNDQDYFKMIGTRHDAVARKSRERVESGESRVES